MWTAPGMRSTSHSSCSRTSRKTEPLPSAAASGGSISSISERRLWSRSRYEAITFEKIASSGKLRSSGVAARADLHTRRAVRGRRRGGGRRDHGGDARQPTGASGAAHRAAAVRRGLDGLAGAHGVRAAGDARVAGGHGRDASHARPREPFLVLRPPQPRARPVLAARRRRRRRGLAAGEAPRAGHAVRGEGGRSPASELSARAAALPAELHPRGHPRSAPPPPRRAAPAERPAGFGGA